MPANVTRNELTQITAAILAHLRTCGVEGTPIALRMDEPSHWEYWAYEFLGLTSYARLDPDAYIKRNDDGTYAVGLDAFRKANEARMALCEHLQFLERAALITIEHFAALPSIFKLSGSFDKLQKALGLSLTELCRRSRHSILVSPLFRVQRTEGYDVFIAMPFQESLNWTAQTIRDSCNALGLRSIRGDDVFGTHHVIDNIFSLIAGTSVVVADCTGKNTNVFYELGLAHAIGKTVILVTQNESDVPFDLRHWRFIQYRQGDQEFSHRLSRHISAAMLEIGSNDDHAGPSALRGEHKPSDARGYSLSALDFR